MSILQLLFPDITYTDDINSQQAIQYHLYDVQLNCQLYNIQYSIDNKYYLIHEYKNIFSHIYIFPLIDNYYLHIKTNYQYKDFYLSFFDINNQLQSFPGTYINDTNILNIYIQNIYNIYFNKNFSFNEFTQYIKKCINLLNKNIFYLE